jgi:hypothetical protein
MAGHRRVPGSMKLRIDDADVVLCGLYSSTYL